MSVINLQLTARVYLRVIWFLPVRLIYLCVTALVLAYGGLDWITLASWGCLAVLVLCGLLGTLETRWGLCRLAQATSWACRRARIHNPTGCICIPAGTASGRNLEPKDLLPILDGLAATRTYCGIDDLFDRLSIVPCLFFFYTGVVRASLHQLNPTLVLGNPSRLELGALFGTVLWVFRAHMLLREAKVWAHSFLSACWVFTLLTLLAAGLCVFNEEWDKYHLYCIGIAAVLLVIYRFIVFCGVTSPDAELQEELMAEFIFELSAAIQLITLGLIYWLVIDKSEKLVLTGFIVAHFVICVGLSLDVLKILSTIRELTRPGDTTGHSENTHAAAVG